MLKNASAVALCLVSVGFAGAQGQIRGSSKPRVHPSVETPTITYLVRVNADDLSGFDVAMRIQNSADTIRVAMPAHQEYDERTWQYVEQLRAESPRGEQIVVREDSAVWRVVAPAGESTIRYRLRLPAVEQGPRAAWRPFLSPTGGLIGGPYGIMYVVGAELAPAKVTLALPAGWEVATPLQRERGSQTYLAPNADALAESPFLVGNFRTWRFTAGGVPHRVVYWPLPNATPFDTSALVDAIEHIARQAVALFGRAPYRDYTFLLQDGAYGGLEHRSAVTLGVPSAELARNPLANLPEIAHEFVHTWNLMSIRPAEYRTVDYRTQRPTAGLWWSEGLTLFYADLLARRAGLPTPDSTRVAHLENLIARYLASPGNLRISPERVSEVAYNALPGALGDYSASTHLQGELLGTSLDLIVRDATNGVRSIDDVMRAVFQRFSGDRGFTGRDLEQAVEEVCHCDVTPFFDAHVRGATPIDFDRYLKAIGFRTRVIWGPAMGRDSAPAPDLRITAWEPANESRLRLLISNPASAWGKAGLHTGDQLAAINDSVVTSWRQFRGLISRMRIGDTVRIETARASGPYRTTVLVTGYDRPFIKIEEVPAATEAQRVLRERWLRGDP